MVVDQDEVDEERRPTHDGQQEECGDDHLLGPGLTIHPVTECLSHKIRQFLLKL